jgi:hypothetical protein
MDKPLVTLRGLLIGMAVLAATLYATAVLPGFGGAHYLAAYLRAVWDRERIEEDKAMLLRTTQLRKDILSGLIQGSLSLQAASDALREDFESRPERLRPCYPPDCPQLRGYTLTVLAWVESELEDDPRRDTILTRLRAEFRANQEARDRPKPAEAPRPQIATVTAE